MGVNLHIGDANNGESELDNSSDADHLLVALRKIMKKEMEVMVIRTIEKIIVPIAEDLIRKVVKEELQSAQEKLSTHKNRKSVDEATTSRPRSLELKFSDNVSDPVLTGKEFIGEEGNFIEVSLVDNVTRHPVVSGPEASAKVEILILEAGPNDNAHNGSLPDFNNSIIRENEKTKPHFSKPVYVYLEKGKGVLSNVRLGHDACWMKSCKCRLGARVVHEFDGSTVKETWTKSFTVLDSRCKLYEKHHPPSLSDPVWRLEKIGKDGTPCKRLSDEMISTVQEFLFLLSINPRKLQKLVGTGAKKWKTTVDHARQCIIDDRRIYLYNSSTEYKTGVVFDTVGQLKGVLRNYQFVPIESAYEAEKAEAQKLLASAFENRMDITSFGDETSFLNQFPCISNDKNATNSSGPDGPDGHNSSIVENIDRYDPTQLVILSPGISPSICLSDIPCHFGSPSSINVEHSSELPFGISDKDPSFSDLDPLLENCYGGKAALSPICSNNDNLPKIPRVESYFYQQRSAGRTCFAVAVTTLQLFFRVRKRAASLGDTQVHKRQRQS